MEELCSDDGRRVVVGAQNGGTSSAIQEWTPASKANTRSRTAGQMCRPFVATAGARPNSEIVELKRPLRLTRTPISQCKGADGAFPSDEAGHAAAAAATATSAAGTTTTTTMAATTTARHVPTAAARAAADRTGAQTKDRRRRRHRHRHHRHYRTDRPQTERQPTILRRPSAGPRARAQGFARPLNI